MERFPIDMQRVQELREYAQSNYPDGATILPGSVLKPDDQVLWLEIAPVHILWGAAPDTFCAYAPDLFGDLLCELPVGYQAEYISDRAPADPTEQPMPVYQDEPPPEQMQQGENDDSERQMGGEHRRKHHHATLQEQRQAVAQVLAQLTDEQRAQAAAKIREKRPELVAQEQQDLGDHRHNAVPPPKSGA